MSCLETTAPNADAAENAVPAKLVFTLATGTGLAVASIYYSQPMLQVMGSSLNADVSSTGLIPTFTQIGYAVGIFFLIPLGDRFDRRQVILVKSLLLAIALGLCGLAGNIHVMLLMSLLIGITATMAQDIVPAAAALAPERLRGKTVGTVMTGLLLGILLSRVVSGFVAQVLGWRELYGLAALSIALIGVALWRVLPRFSPGTQMSYPALLHSMGQLWKRYPGLRHAAIAQGLLSIGFSAFWSTLAIMLHEVYGLGSASAGAFGLAGAAGALVAPLSGMLADRHGPGRVTQVGSAIVALSFALMFAMPWLPIEGQLVLIAVSAIGFDLGIQATMIAHQTLIYGLQPEARGRLNALLFTTVFIGMAIGSVLGSEALEKAGWPAVVGLSVMAGIGSLIVRLRKDAR
jgi:predicted MFS family arabinose efflux permease